MTDIVERLKLAIMCAKDTYAPDPLHQPALDEIERLRAAEATVNRLRQEIDYLHSHMEAVAKDIHKAASEQWHPSKPKGNTDEKR